MEVDQAERIPPPAHETTDIDIAVPPEVTRTQSNPLIRLVPIITAVATVGAMAAAYYARSTVVRNPAFMMFPLMMLVSAVATALSGADRRRGHINVQRADYLGYLSELRTTVLKNAAAQHYSMTWRHPEPDTLWTLVGGARMWERAITDSDFCHVRIGLGTLPLATRLVAPATQSVNRLDPVGVAALQRFLRTHSTVSNLPIAVPLDGLAAVRIRGHASQARALARAMICQLAVMHSPETVSIAAVVDERSRPDWEWLKWLPHNRHPNATDDIGPARMVYPSVAAARAALGAQGQRHTVVVVDSEERSDDRAGHAATMLTIESTDDEPLVVFASGQEVAAHADQLSYATALVCAQRLAGYRVGRSSARSRGTDWQDLVGIADITCYSAVAHRSAKTLDEFLRVPVGTNDTGEPVELDIKEAAANGMGPHGLCIGATGSGKSEFLRTVALGMIVGHSPQDLNLVLVDFKGGATFAGLDPAPHVAAVITNLADKAALVARMRDALMGEMYRRQEVLRAAGNLDGVTAYGRRRRAGARLDPLPALFIIVDEFSELLSQQPDFADVFVAIGRLGRSLGIHLLLASQRLDEGRLRGLESHLSYRICLKTLSANESRTVLGTPDAYELPGTPGAAYLRVGTDAPVRFQTAFVSGPSATSLAVDEHVSPARNTGALVHAFTTAPVGPVSCDRGADTESGAYRTVLQAIIEQLCDDGPRAHEVWLPPLSASPSLDTVGCDLEPAATLTAPIGIVDRPFEQRRTPLMVDLSGAAGNVAVVGAPQSGKSTALRTLITALAVTHDPRLVQFYCLDFGGGSLAMLRDWPHVGSVAGRSDGERVRNTLLRLAGIVRSRETLFREHGIESMGHYRRLKAEQDRRCDRFGDIFLVVDGWLSLQREVEAAESWLTSLAAEGLSYGVHTVVTASRWAEIRPALRDQIGTRIELRLGDPSDSEVDRRRAQQVPEGNPGRGLSQDGMHMVVALPRLDGDGVERLRRRHGGWVAPPVPVLPAHIDLERIVEQAAEVDTGVVLGVEETELESLTIDFAQQQHLLILGDGECGKTATLRALCGELLRTTSPAQCQLFIVDPRRSLLGVVEPQSGQLGDYVTSVDAIRDAMPRLLELLRRRLPPADVTATRLRDRSWWCGPEIYTVIDDYDLVGGAGGNALTALLEILPYSRDVGFHLVVARRSSGAARAMFEPVLAGLRDAGCATLLMSASAEEGLTVGPVRPSPLPPGRGVLITRRGDPQTIQVGWTPVP
ncbi:type VII secretion protein EccC [Mycobacterium sp. 1245111.1]|uniref:type VII secretion protein EccCa n=1 Tax=Mycobacterium sp. 1245111.1 TaxID=1834073 RepID=UPI000801FED6|nr:type VII secretion protein EccCa [Mycobacterium sp. 1245111.1]OBK32467.1 type VII secretion protein EccC [Mycobacterium sp. 1245111.1]